MTVNQQKNVTMIFLDGTHIVDFVQGITITITAPFVKMTGDISSSKSAAVYCYPYICELRFYNTSTVCIENLVMTFCHIYVNTPWSQSGLKPGPTKFRLVSVKVESSAEIEGDTITLNESEAYFEQVMFIELHLDFYFSNITFITCTVNNTIYESDTTRVTMENCQMFDIIMRIDSSSFAFSGVTEFVGGKYEFSPIISYSNNITLSGNVLFVNNSQNAGGAMALYSSTLSFAAGVNVSFISNSAFDKGGAIYIEPGITPNMILGSYYVPICFYHLLDCNDNATYNVFFANNSATNGGDNIYGATLHGLCTESKKV